jgi:hypothetical protein
MGPLRRLVALKLVLRGLCATGSPPVRLICFIRINPQLFFVSFVALRGLHFPA